ncbi:glycosyltransferase family protein [Bacteroides ihuae]|uniref:hypothetical protein n=1 Tax=Bacteroides ihuae TaxID=1852362 RepID=UPI0008D946DB|nr:hypothetical protein [Bacteroides ihuae]
MSFSLIVPIAAEKQEYASQLPPMFALNKEGVLLCVKAIMGLDLTQFDAIYFTILRSHDERYCLCELLNLQFRRLGLDKARVVVLDKPTRSQPETIYQTVILMNISGSIFVKDADCYFAGEILSQNGVAIYPLEKLELVNPQNKSYVAVDDMFYVTNIIEKKIISHYFNAGGYCFEDASVFLKYFERLSVGKGLYLSHIVYAMLLDKLIFRPFQVTSYIDFERLVQL